MLLTINGGGTWQRVSMVLADGRAFLTLTDTVYHTGASTTTVYAGRLSGDALRPVRDMTVSGGLTYGDISARGDAVQVYMGIDYSSARYWYARDGVHFKAGPVPCSPPRQALTAQASTGQPVALCAGSPSDLSGAPALGA